MADIDSILAGVGGNTRADFSGIADIPKAYWDGKDQKAKNDLRDAFKPTAENPNGVPMKDGQLDLPAIMKTLFQKGDIAGGVGLLGASVGAADRAALGSIDGPQASQPPIVSPPSSNRSATSVVAPPLNKGGATPGGPSQQPGPVSTGQNSIVGIVGNSIPDELAGPIIAQVSALSKTDPNAPINDPATLARITQVAQAAIARAQGRQPQQGQPPAAGPPQQLAPQVAQPAQIAPQDDQILKRLTLLAASPDKATAAAAKVRLESYLKNKELTPEQKNYNFATTNPAFDERAQDNATAEARGKVQGETYAKKYESLIDNGSKAQQEIPQLQMLQEQMNDPNFFSGAGEKYNFLYKQLKSAVGIDPNAAVPQEFLRKATAANVLGSLGALKGLGQIRVAEIGLAKDASAAPNTSVPANKLLTEMAIRTHQRNADIADMAQGYAQKNGGLDAGFDKIATDYGKSHPLFTDAEIKDWRLAIGQAGNDGKSASAAQLKFSNPSEVHSAIAAGKLKKGDSFLDSNGKTRYVP